LCLNKEKALIIFSLTHRLSLDVIESDPESLLSRHPCLGITWQGIPKEVIPRLVEVREVTLFFCFFIACGFDHKKQSWHGHGRHVRPLALIATFTPLEKGNSQQLS
jgi:hypothetical protein